MHETLGLNGSFWPVWQSSPVHLQAINLDLTSHPYFGEDLAQAIESEQVGIGRIADISNSDDSYHFLYQEIGLIVE